MCLAYCAMCIYCSTSERFEKSIESTRVCYNGQNSLNNPLSQLDCLTQFHLHFTHAPIKK